MGYLFTFFDHFYPFFSTLFKQKKNKPKPTLPILEVILAETAAPSPGNQAPGYAFSLDP